MGIRKVTGGAPTILGVSSLARWQEWIAWPSYNVAAAGSPWTGIAFARHMPTPYSAGNPASVWTPLGNQQAIFQVINDIQVLDVFAIAAAIGGQENCYTFRAGLVTAGWGLDFSHAFPTALEAAPGVETRLACVVQGWMRKRLAGDATSSAQFVGIVNNNGDINRSSRVARIGIMGDGVLGFRFGSLNCPDAVATGGTDNAATAIDPGSFQPANLVNPGASWFHAKIKMIPATEAQTGRVGCYLNGRLVVTFTSAARMPRTSLSSIDVAGSPYWPLQPAFAAWGNGGAAPSPGYYLRDLRVRLDEDVSL